MPVSVMQIRQMRMAMAPRLMPVRVAMLVAGRVGWRMRVIVVRIVMTMAMIVFQRLVRVRMFMSLAEM